ncbi:VOC family protein [Pleomorphovibrio marinus]|uniref:VOC family protein n=1 Tax=Pleomorphovibrio marinus TaxID=2164132 RepID=UPI000E0AAA70|nr:VOC family protein [Pleomorphovibrio marinus]
MKIEHVSMWVSDLEKMRKFYEKYFGARSGNKYHNAEKNFSSYFLNFKPGCRLELMHKPDLGANPQEKQPHLGMAHFAISVGSKQLVDDLTALLKKDGFTVASKPRTTGDGYYESVIKDPDGNLIEIVT